MDRLLSDRPRPRHWQPSTVGMDMVGMEVVPRTTDRGIVPASIIIITTTRSC